ncbi:DUF2938 domain-containing protein [Oxalobacteraceae bacterium OM1]|nr:DUF2938 domain-containing protein [Oxalobacteraceae bacterium OM1]
MTVVETILRIVVIGTGATAVMDAWLMALKRMGIQTQNFAMIGRWMGHLFKGRFAHASIAKAATVPGELALGWLTHYAVGIAFAGLLVVLRGAAWLHAPAVLPAVAVGLCTVAFPLFVMQPAMGLGIAASRTPAPWKNRLRSMANHTVFGFGLYLSALVIAWMLRWVS